MSDSNTHTMLAYYQYTVVSRKYAHGRNLLKEGGGRIFEGGHIFERLRYNIIYALHI